ncbi:MAG: glyoxalase [Candidatus Marinimicrobia bacterium]|nr:glyoxalase [Candidatus Neomarinimicrobiota bacterium]|tara:strand:+ start:3845 stop:4144 length:300 start_codon:yes stop_codon:yes gene_type:complete
MNKLENIDHIAIQVKNIKKSVKWYTDNYNCKVIYSDDTWGFLQFENIKLALVTNSEHPPHFAILDEKIKLDSSTVKHRDGSVSKYIKDLDGNFIELIKY